MQFNKDIVNVIANLSSPITIARWASTSKLYFTILSKHPFIIFWRSMLNNKSLWYVIEQAARSGYGDLVSHLLYSSRRAGEQITPSKMRYIMWGACLGGHEELTQELFEKLPPPLSPWCDLLSGIYFAARGGHRKLVNLLLYKLSSLGTFRSNQPRGTHWNSPLQGAARGGSLDLVKLFIERGATSWNEGLHSALQGGHMHLVKFFIEKGARGFESGFYFAIQSGDRSVVDFVMDCLRKNGDLEKIDWNRALYQAAWRDHKHLIEFCMEKGATAFHLALLNASGAGHAHLVQFFVEKGASNFDVAIESAKEYGHLDIVKLLTNLKSKRK